MQSEREQFEIDYRTILASLQTHPDEHTKRLMWWAFRRGLAACIAHADQVRALVEAVLECKAAEDAHASQEAYEWLVTAAAAAATLRNNSRNTTN